MSPLAERITDLPLSDDLSVAIDEAIKTAGGDARTAVGALIFGAAIPHGSLRPRDLGWICPPPLTATA